MSHPLQGISIPPIEAARTSERTLAMASVPITFSAHGSNEQIAVRGITPTTESRPRTPAVIGGNEEEMNDEDFDDLLATEAIENVHYTQGTLENDQMILLLDTIKGSKLRGKYRTQVIANFHSYICCIISAEIVTKEPKMNMKDIHYKAFLSYITLDNQNYFGVLNSGHGLFQNLVEKKIPDFVIEFCKNFITKGLGNVDESVNEATRHSRGEDIWKVYQKIRREVCNTANILVRDIKSGENLTGLLLEIREKLFLMDQSRKRKERFQRTVSGIVGKGQKSEDKKKRKDYITSNQKDFVANNPLPNFDVEWFPDSWLVFVYIGRGSSQPEGEANPFRPRSCKNISEHETKNLEEISSYIKYKNKNIRRGVRNSLLSNSHTNIIDLSDSNEKDIMKTPKTNIVISLEKGLSFTTASIMEQVNEQQKIVQMYKDLNSEGLDVTDQEIKEEQLKVLSLLRSRNQKQPLSEVRSSTKDGSRDSRKRNAEDESRDSIKPNSDEILEERNLSFSLDDEEKNSLMRLDEIDNEMNADEESVNSLSEILKGFPS